MTDQLPIIACKALSKTYQEGALKVKVLHSIDFAVYPGECVAIVGPSGSGKSTLLHLLGGLDNPSSGQIFVNDIELTKMSEKQRCQLRNRHFGFVYQFHHLLPEFTALENVAMPLLIGDKTIPSATDAATAMLQRVGLGKRLQHKLAQLSGGERQRTAIARALVTHPKILFADEPTGNLDHHTAEQVFSVLLELNHSLQTSLLIVTHDLRLAHRMDRVLLLEDGFLRPFEKKLDIN